MELQFIDKGVLDYQACWDDQEALFSLLIAEKEGRGEPSANHYFLLVEHPHVYTLGKSGDPGNLLIRPEFLEKIGASFYRINRGGDITYHGPGQLVGYPILDLEFFGLSVRNYIRKMEEALLLTLSDFGISGARKEGATGVWLDPDDPARARKICAIGVRVSRYVTMHGFALNVNTDLRYFSYINPCGFTSGAVTSMQKETGSPVDMVKVKESVKGSFSAVFGSLNR